MSVTRVVERIREKVGKHPDRVSAIDGSFQFVLTGDDGGAFYARVVDGRAEIEEGRIDDPSVTITMSAADFADMAEGRLNPAGAFMSGKLKMEGDIGLALRLQNLLG